MRLTTIATSGERLAARDDKVRNIAFLSFARYLEEKDGGGITMVDIMNKMQVYV